MGERDSCTESGPTSDSNDILFGVRSEALIPGLPSEWEHWPVRIHVGFGETPTRGVYRKLFEEYTRYSLRDALTMLFSDEGRDNLLAYRFAADGFVPTYGFFAIWPLARRGLDEPTTNCVGSGLFVRSVERGIFPRTARGGAAPWEAVADDTLFELCNEPVGVHGFRQVLTLRVGGRTIAEAGENWVTCAKAIRQFRKNASSIPSA